MFTRTASDRDLDAVRALLVETWHATYDAIYGRDRVTAITDDWHSIEALRARLKQPHSEFIVADDGAAIGGMAFASAVEGGSVVMLHQLYVRPSMHGRGIGGMLMDEIEACFPEARTMRLEVEEANAPAIRFYVSRGYRQVGRTANCGRGGSGIPAAIYEMPLG